MNTRPPVVRPLLVGGRPDPRPFVSRHGDQWPTHDDNVDLSSEWPSPPLIRWLPDRQMVADIAAVTGVAALIAFAARAVAAQARRRLS